MSKVKTQSKNQKAGTKKQAETVVEAQLQAMFGETIKSISELVKKKRQMEKQQKSSE